MSPLASGLESAVDIRCGRALVARFTSEPVEAPAAMCVREWVETVTSRLTAAQACAVVEHLFGVLPLMEFFGRADEPSARIASGSMLGALGLFTPSPEPGWGAVRLAGEWTGGALHVSGGIRLPCPAVDGAIVLVHVTDAEQRLAWLDLHIDGVEGRDSSRGASAAADESPCWLLIDGATIDAALVSRPITLAPGTECYRRLEEYASIWALAAVHLCRRIVRALRRAARTVRCGEDPGPFRASQLVSTTVTEAEIEIELAAAAADRAISGAEPVARTGLVLALSAARTLAAATAMARQLHDQLGLPLDGWLADAAAPAVTTYLGGTLMLENEVARALGLSLLSAGAAS